MAEVAIKTASNLAEGKNLVDRGELVVGVIEDETTDERGRVRFWDGRCGDCITKLQMGPCPHPELGAWVTVSDFGGNAQAVMGHQRRKGYLITPPAGYKNIVYAVMDRNGNRVGTHNHTGERSLRMADVVSGLVSRLPLPEAQVEEVEAPRKKKRSRRRYGRGKRY